MTLSRHQLGAIVKDQRAVEVLGVVDAVLDLVAVAVELALLRAIAFHVAVDVDLDDLVGREEAVADALLEGVGVRPARRSSAMLETYFVSFGVAVRPIWVAAEK